MCFFKKKEPKTVIESKFTMKQHVYFRRNGELMFGWIYEIKQGKDGKIIYDVQVGGQCPAVIHDLPEESLWVKKEK